MTQDPSFVRSKICKTGHLLWLKAPRVKSIPWKADDRYRNALMGEKRAIKQASRIKLNDRPDHLFVDGQTFLTRFPNDLALPYRRQTTDNGLQLHGLTFSLSLFQRGLVF